MHKTNYCLLMQIQAKKVVKTINILTLALNNVAV